MGKQVITTDDSGLPAALAAWIKRDQEERLQHQENMAMRRHQEDVDVYRKHLGEIMAEWPKIKTKEKMILVSLANHHLAGKNFSPAQRSLIMGFYMKYCLV